MKIAKRITGIVLLGMGVIIASVSGINQIQHGLFAGQAYLFAGFLLALGLVLIFDLKLHDVF